MTEEEKANLILIQAQKQALRDKFRNEYGAYFTAGRVDRLTLEQMKRIQAIMDEKKPPIVGVELSRAPSRRGS